MSSNDPVAQALAAMRARVAAAQELRPEVRAFAELMERVLRANDRKGGWKHMKPPALLRRLDEEVAELHGAVNIPRQPLTPIEHTWVAREAADVANFAMFIADVYGDMPSPTLPALSADVLALLRVVEAAHRLCSAAIGVETATEMEEWSQASDTYADALPQLRDALAALAATPPQDEV